MLNEIKQALEKATPGPLSARCEEWPGNDNLRHWVDTHDDGIGAFVRYEDAHLAANAPEWLQWCVDEIERLRKEIIEKGGWISVKERLPEKNGDYLVYYQKGRSDIAFFNGQSWHKAYKITHWQPLPEPPKEGEV